MAETDRRIEKTMASSSFRAFICGLNHKGSSLDDREPLGFGHDELAAANAAFSSLPEVTESAIVATCNRVEFYFVAARRTDPFATVRKFYRREQGIDITSLEDKFYIMRDRETAAHLFRVAGGLDSMVLGENQIFGQLKEAYSSTCSVKAAGKVVHRLFHQAFRIGKQIRSDTAMGKGACSVSSAAMELLRTRLGEFDDPTVLFVGVNQMISLAASNLGREQHGPFLFANRTPEKAGVLAERHDGAGYGLDDLPSLMARADIMITCTGSDLPIVSPAMIHDALAENPNRRFVIVDMATPRDVNYQSNGCPGVEVYDLEDVQRHVQEQQQRRAAALPEAEEIVERRLDEFMYWFDNVRRAPVSRSVRESFEAIRSEELDQVIGKLSPELRDEVTEASRTLIKRLVQMTAKTCSKCSKSE